MSTMNDILNDEEALFIPSDDNAKNQKPKYIAKMEGEYLGHIAEARTTVTQWTDRASGNLFSACIYNFKVCVAPENRGMQYTTADGSTHDGESYVGWNIIANGVFRFLEPKDGDKFVSNAQGNDRYLRFCQALGMEIKTVSREVNGKTMEVSVLPTLDPKEINGLPVTAFVGRHKEDWINDQGKSMPQWRCKFIKSWNEGKKLATSTDDLPF
ncbi:MAG: hypothetical protein CBD97_01695 [Pelagibacteraceae bacterium TMED237]|nr:MAG: hypothetical protein CBD97_01695 [Pelagibacteraceae bacterium TMED237]|tara:strand:- start:14348 stop:14983 length:636 start_codon:yes stop_codon:yes gene_type:complete